VTTNRSIRGLAILCNRQGQICKHLHDELNVLHADGIGASFSVLFDAGSVEKAQTFLQTLLEQQFVHDWELSVVSDQRPILLHFVGALVEEGLLIVGASDRGDSLRYYDELMQMNNEQANSLRIMRKEQAVQAQRGQLDEALYDEISRLNNELVTAQRELMKKNAQLERLIEQKNELLGIAAHDLRNPLSAIALYSKLMIDDGGLSDEQLSFITVVYENSQFVFQLINNLLDISKIEAGRLDLALKPTPLLPLLERSVTLSRMLAQRKQIEIEFSVEPDLPLLLLDGSKIHQVVDNLLSNAIKFSYSETTVQVKAVLRDHFVQISVTDQGQGIPPDEVEKLFEPFTRSSVRPTAGEQSTGLGLAIVRRIVEGHRGQVWLESKVNHGSTFYFSLPVIGGENGDMGANQQENGGDLSGRPIGTPL
jgi:two-component system, OmpR family, sensor kinase